MTTLRARPWYDEFRAPLHLRQSLVMFCGLRSTARGQANCQREPQQALDDGSLSEPEVQVRQLSALDPAKLACLTARLGRPCAFGDITETNSVLARVKVCPEPFFREILDHGQEPEG